jgi:uncharacterized protein (TIGR04141 family)
MSAIQTKKIVIYKLRSHELVSEIDLTSAGYYLEFDNGNQRLFVNRGRRSKPHWFDYIKPLLSTHVNDITNTSTSFILLIHHKESGYAITGGYGYTTISDHIVADFGLNVVLRMLDPSTISTIQQRALKGTTRQLLRAVSGYNPMFDRDNFNRVLNSLEGKGIFEGKRFRVSGRSSLTLRTVRSVNDVSDVLDDIESIISKSEQIHFPRSYEIVTDNDLLSTLDRNMLDAFLAYWAGDASREKIYLEFDDPFTQFQCTKFKITYQRKRIETEDFDLDIIRAAFLKNNILLEGDDFLHHLYVTGIGDDDQEIFSREPLDNMLVFEITLHGHDYIRLGTKWCRILDEMQSFIKDELRNIHIDRTLLPAWDKGAHESENEYNNFVAKSTGWACLDADFVYIEGRSKIEVCDLFDKSQNQFIHVKDTWGSKSAYLFTQGTTSAEMYRQSVLFRQKCAEKWPDLFDGDIREATVVFGIASHQAIETDFPHNMTYFAKLNLYNATMLLRQYGFTVVVAPIAILRTENK